MNTFNSFVVFGALVIFCCGLTLGAELGDLKQERDTQQFNASKDVDENAVDFKSDLKDDEQLLAIIRALDRVADDLDEAEQDRLDAILDGGISCESKRSMKRRIKRHNPPAGFYGCHLHCRRGEATFTGWCGKCKCSWWGKPKC